MVKETVTGTPAGRKPVVLLRSYTKILIAAAVAFAGISARAYSQGLEEGFRNPPHEARPGVYWYFMDGNISAEAVTGDLESMKKTGIEHVIFLEVNVGVPRGRVDFMSDEWKDLFKFIVDECERLGIDITLGVGPGWAGSGGPWVKPEESMQHLVGAAVTVDGGVRRNIELPLPAPYPPFFGEGNLPDVMKVTWREYYQDVAVMAFPAVEEGHKIADIGEKALYFRAPYSSQPGVRPYIEMPAVFGSSPNGSYVTPGSIIDLTHLHNGNGVIEWDVPDGRWEIIRFVSRNNGAVTRPAPVPGLGFESDKFDPGAFEAHFDSFVGELFRWIDLPSRRREGPGGIKVLHLDSWEMGAQNWTGRFREEFTARRGYDPFPYYPVYAGYVVGSEEISERFLWDLRLTSQELILENHVGLIRDYAARHGLKMSIEPYDMNPTADLELGAVADIPMCEYWRTGFGFNTSFSAFEGTSLANLKGQPVVPAEAFTAHFDGWKTYPGALKNQNDWAFAAGINRLTYHTFQHQALPDHLKPGMTMGPYGVHWDRGQTWWDMADGYHGYVGRSQFLLQQGRTVSDILYLAPEGAPHVFRAPESAVDYQDPFMPDKKGYGFDACPPSLLYMAETVDGNIVFPGGASYRVLVLPDVPAMSPKLLNKIKELIQNGAAVVGNPPLRAPGLEGYPACDSEVGRLTQTVWGGKDLPDGLTADRFGKGTIIYGKILKDKVDNLYPDYDLTSRILKEKLGTGPDFSSDGSLRYLHRTSDDADIYFVSNKSDRTLKSAPRFRTTGRRPELWHAETGEIRLLPEYAEVDGTTEIPLEFGPHESYFVVFRDNPTGAERGANFPSRRLIATLDNPWKVSFDPAWGGPGEVVFDRLSDWTTHDDPGIRYYSGTAVYETSFDLPRNTGGRLFLDLNKVNVMARVTLNGNDLGVVWTDPLEVEITGHVKRKGNHLTVEVVNLWPNRLIGDSFMPDDGIKAGQWPGWLLDGKERESGRYTFTTYDHYGQDSELLPSGLMGPVTISVQADAPLGGPAR